VRIQLPEAESTSYHSDGWYGHGESVRSFWMPLTRVVDGNTLYIAENIDSSLTCLESIINAKASLREINEIAQAVCLPFEGDYGDLLSFSSAMIHGANKNTKDYTRVSFDFRIAPDKNDLGSKPISNFYTREELDSSSSNNSGSNSSDNSSLVGITYSNLCNGVSAKAQLLLCASYCEANNINIIGNESEIVTLDYMPVMRHYLTQTELAQNCIIVFSLGVFNEDKNMAKQILDLAKSNNKNLVFCAEGIIYDGTVSEKVIIDRI